MSSGILRNYGKNFILLTSKARLPVNANHTTAIRTLCINNLKLGNSSLPPSSENTIQEPFIPPYEQKQGESLKTLKARLLYQSRKRGMLENGLLLSTFAAKFLNSMSETELKEYDRLINLPSNDWDIYYWATGVKPIPNEFDTAILHKFIDHVRNTDKESRLTQPDLN